MKDEMELSLNDLDVVSGGTAGENVVSSGFFTSDTGTGLNIRADWSVVAGAAGGRTLELDVFATSYSLQSAALQNGVELHVNGASYLADSLAIDYRGKDRTRSLLASFSVPNLSGPVSVAVVWRFKGSYSGVALQELRAEATIIV